MFPNVRLMIAAVFASVLALSCGFGVFAAFRVNHEPLNRLPSGTAPPQFVIRAAAPITVALAIADTVSSRFESSDAQATVVGAGSPTSPIDRPGQDEPPVAVSASVAQPAASTDPSPEPAAEPQQAPIATSGADAPARQSATPDAVVPLPETQSTNAGEDGQPDAMTDNTGALPTTAAPDSTLADQPTEQARPLPQEKVGQMVMRKKRIVRRRTAVIPRRVIRARAPAVAEVNGQTYALPQQNFSFPSQTAPQVAQQASQLGQQQLLLKPRRSIRRAVVHKKVIKKAAAADPLVRPSVQ